MPVPGTPRGEPFVRDSLDPCHAADPSPSPVLDSCPADGTKVYVANYGSGTVSVIDTANGNLVTSITTGGNPFDIAINDTGSTAYVTDRLSGNVYVIDTATQQVMKTITVGSSLGGIAVNDGPTTQIYVANDTNPGTMSMVLV